MRSDFLHEEKDIRCLYKKGNFILIVVGSAVVVVTDSVIRMVVVVVVDAEAECECASRMET